MAHAQKPEFVFLRNGRVHLNRQGRQFSRLLAAEVCASAVVMLDTPCSEVVWRVLATYSIRRFPLHFPFRASTVCHHISAGLYYMFRLQVTIIRQTFQYTDLICSVLTVWDPIWRLLVTETCIRLYIIGYIVMFWLNNILVFCTTTRQDGFCQIFSECIYLLPIDCCCRGLYRIVTVFVKWASKCP